MICRRDIQGESSSSKHDVSRFSPDSLRSGNHRKSLEVLAFNLRVKAHVKTSNKGTARCTNARHCPSHCLGICSSCWFQQDGATVHTTIRARSWLKSRTFGGSHQPPGQAPVAGQESGPVPWTWFWSVAMTELKRRPPTTTTLVEVKKPSGPSPSQ